MHSEPLYMARTGSSGITGLRAHVAANALGADHHQSFALTCHASLSKAPGGDPRTAATAHAVRFA